jgi:predicted nucleic acid-binding protein
VATYIADTSAWAHAQRRGAPPALRDRFSQLLVEGEIATCDMVQWELLHSTNDASEFSKRRLQLDALDRCPIRDADWQRALDVCQALARRTAGLHRSIKVQDTLIAVAAERAGLVVLHYDSDYETIATVTEQPTEWIAPRGSL